MCGTQSTDISSDSDNPPKLQSTPEQTSTHNDIKKLSHLQSTSSEPATSHYDIEDPQAQTHPILSQLQQSTLVHVTNLMENEARQPGLTTMTDAVQYSPDLQMLVALGVSLKDVEKINGALDFLTEIKYYQIGRASCRERV